MGDTAYILEPVQCDFCKMTGAEVQAQYDGATVHGPWAYMCDDHFQANGVGLGTGRGQKLIIGERPKDPSFTEDADMDDIPPTEYEKPAPSNGIRSKIEWPNM